MGGREECQKLFDEVLAREFSDLLYASMNRTTVDCYAMQHPERYCASFKSFAAHLAGLCCVLEFGKDPRMMRAIHTGLYGQEEPTRPAFVERRGEITIESVHRAGDATSHRIAVEAWAAAVWKAWSRHHEFARSLLRDMVESAKSSKRAPQG